MGRYSTDEPEYGVKKNPSTIPKISFNRVYIRKLLARECRTGGNAPAMHEIEIQASFQVTSKLQI